MASEYNNYPAMCSLGKYYETIKDYENMKKYYNIALIYSDIDNKSKIMFRLGVYYKSIEQDYENMKKYFNMAFECGNDMFKSHASCQLGHYYHETKDYDNMLKYYLTSVEYGNIFAMYCLGSYYKEIKDYNNMKKYYLIAIKNINNNIDKLSPDVIEKMKKDISNMPDNIIVLENDEMYKNDLVLRMTCCICMTNEQNMVFNCGHSTCSMCALKITECGLCKTKITIRIKQFR
jgi:tetratricopeptide (TPR) repeat protein